MKKPPEKAVLFLCFLLHTIDDDFAVGVFILGNPRKFASDIVEFYNGVDETFGVNDFICKKVYRRIEPFLTAVTCSCFSSTSPRLSCRLLKK